MRFFTKKEDRFLLENYTKIPCKRMAKTLGRTEGTARQRLKVLGITVPPKVVAKFKQESRFVKGHASFNKGKKQAEYMTRQAIKRTEATRFKKGGIPVNHKPLGSTRMTKDGFLEIKVMEPNKWKHLHRLVWEETFGEIPKGMLVRFVTKDRLNLNPSNLELISRKENMIKNSVHNYPAPIAKMVQLRGALNRQINKHLKRINEK
jgi:hypothetical protein